MKRNLLPFFGLLFCFPMFSQSVSYTVFDEILFYDGYAATVDHPVPDGVIRHRNDLYATKLTDEQLASLGSDVTVNVIVKAACDNYDRIGNVNLAFVPKGQTTYDPDDVQRIEIGRFITPFMNKNIMPNQVPYTYSLNNLSRIFKDPEITSLYDIWAELEIFGVPYAANTQVAGCAGRNDVFYGTLEFVSSGNSAWDNPYTALYPLSMKVNLNNYQEGATDQVGTTVRTITFETEETIYAAKFYLITSNHGANQGGEEYIRRWHYVNFNGTQVLSYRPGGLSCEPFRMYNTQANGIYGQNPQSPAWWASWNNWCPGDVIPVRTIDLGTLEPGTHTFVLSVPAAQFVDQQGYIPVSLYLQGTYSEAFAGVENPAETTFSIYPNPVSDVFYIESQETLKEVVVFDVVGQQVIKTSDDQINTTDLQSGIYFVQVEFENAQKAVRKIIKK
ncbi:MAG: peptide-N-glycosidase F-related protein [Flavobacteriaceae bacterium]